MLKFMYNGIKVNNELFRAHYSLGELFHYPKGTITIYAREYKHFPKIDGLTIKNDTDSMTDYFETDTIYIQPDNPYYKEIHAVYTKQEDHNIKAHNKRMGGTIPYKAI